MITFASIANSGGRAVNEDSAVAFKEDERCLFALADGLGGHGQGDVASQLVTAKCLEVFKEGGGLEDCFQDAQNSLLDHQRQNNASGMMKTTLALLIIEGEIAQWGHVGDSRIYHFEKSTLSSRTMDHSVPQMLFMSGEIREKDIRHHEDRSRLLRALGVEWDGQLYEISKGSSLRTGDNYLLCSDGFWEWIVEKRMRRLLKSSSTPELWLSAMEAEVLKNAKGKEMDNYSAIAVFVG